MTKTKISLKNLLKNKSILITGGAGSLGIVLVEKLLTYPVKQIRVLDVNEHALFQLKRKFDDNRLRILFGNITNSDRLEIACNQIDIIIHAAALKNIEITEFNAIDTVDINVNGTLNIIKTAIKTEPKIFLNISTDKVASSSTLYGTTKEIGERLTTWASTHFQTTKFASVRFGNIIETRGNVFEVWKEESENNKPLSITDPNMKRFFWHVDEAADFILDSLNIIKQGDIIIPKMKSYKIKELANKISKNQKIIGLRPGEKKEEILMTSDELKCTIERKNMWIIKNNI
ncbi:polysaccharide biosynthesis protein [Nitrosopumilus sp. b2]|uniref:polysaccharide biosynthesis protein n=1 Tax=Nitrosopumilus sp. b2 TaxID=2109908 RepID=UPI0015F4291F|nr:polysaccharide biosynthesis protein [Nitrosopumilus sp. b2]KAF6245778.1 hypothetical protein C6989_01180 [Nitrosopumilus sp. b2]